MKSLLKLLMLCVSVNVSAQESAELKVSKSATVNFAIAPSKMNVLYMGVPNPLKIAVSGIPQDQVKVTANIPIKQLSDGSFEIQPMEKEPVVIKLEYLGKVIGEETFRVNRIPDPVATLDNRYVSGRISAASMHEVKQLRAELAGSFLEAEFNVVYFNFTLRAKDADLKSLRTNGPNFTTEMMQLLRGCKSGDAIFIDEIRAVGPDKRERKLAGLAFEIK